MFKKTLFYTRIYLLESNKNGKKEILFSKVKIPKEDKTEEELTKKGVTGHENVKWAF